MGAPEFGTHKEDTEPVSVPPSMTRRRSAQLGTHNDRPTGRGCVDGGISFQFFNFVVGFASLDAAAL